jgi:hypothetical protein
MRPMENLVKLIKLSLGLLDNHYVRLVLVVLLVAYSAGVMPSLNQEVSAGLSNMWVRLFVLLVIMYVSVKDVALAMLLAVAYVLTVHMSGGNVEGMHGGAPHGATEAEDEDDAESPAPVTEGLDEDEQIAAPSGYKPSNNACLQDCADGESLPQGSAGQCGATATWEGENNAQGMNCPMGYGGEELATF